MKISENLSLHRRSARNEASDSPEVNENISRRARNVRALVRLLNHLPGIGVHVTEVRRFLLEYEKPWRCPRGYSREIVTRENYPMEIVHKTRSRRKSSSDSASAQEISRTRPVILQLHGGGYYGKLHNVYRRMAVCYSSITEGMDVATIDYRVAPEYTYPAAVEDALDAYLYLSDLYPDVILTGDSAGGGLSLALTLKLRDLGLKLPKRIITMSAWTDLTASGPSYDDNFLTDPVFGGSRESLIYSSPYVGDDDPENPYISPAFGDFTGFPPVLMQVGEMEMVLSDTLTVSEKLKEAGASVTTHVFPGMFHDFQMGLNTYPESQAAWEEIREFLSEAL